MLTAQRIHPECAQHTQERDRLAIPCKLSSRSHVHLLPNADARAYRWVFLHRSCWDPCRVRTNSRCGSLERHANSALKATGSYQTQTHLTMTGSERVGKCSKIFSKKRSMWHRVHGEEFLRERCGDDASLMADIKDLLEADKEVISGANTEVRRTSPDATPEFSLPGYELLKVLGEGGMATVYLARHELLKREVALKVIRDDLSNDTAFSRRFLSEGQILARLDHPNIITVFDVGQVGANYYMSMEYIQGGTLLAFRDRPSPPEVVARIAIQLAEALEQAHGHGFLHRDIKPANVLIKSDTEFVLTDFGIAKPIEQHETQLTRIGFSIGTPNYMSPEQLVGGDVDPRTDLFSLGVMLYELLTGGLPTGGSLAQAMMTRNLEAPGLPEPLTEWQPVMDGLLQKNPDARFNSASTLIEHLQPLLGQYGLTDDSRRLTKKQKIGLGVLIIAAIAGVALSVSLITRMSSDEPIDTGPIARELTSEEQRKVDLYNQAGDMHLEVGRCRTPPASSAETAYRMVLEIDPANAHAQAGLARIRDLGDACR